MADTVIDKGQATSWAQEATLKRILGEAKVSSKFLEQLAKKDLSKEELDAINNLRDLSKENTEEAKKTNKGIGNLGTSFANSVKGLGGFTKGLATGFSKDSDTAIQTLAEASTSAGKSIKDVGSQFGFVGKTLGFFANTILAANAAFLGLWTTASDLNKSLVSTYNSGARFEEGLRGLATSADKVGITTGELAGIFANFGSAVSLVGTTRAVELAKSFVNVRKSSGELMMTNSEAAEAVFEYMDAFKGLSSMQSLSNERITSEARDYWMELTALSEATGRQRKELSKSIDQQVHSLSFNAAIAKFYPEQREAMRKTILDLQKFGPETAKTFTDVVTSFISTGGIAGLDETMQMVIAQSGLFDAFQDLTRGVEEGDIGPAMSKLADQMADPEVAKYISQQAMLPGPIGEAARKIQELSQSAIKVKDQEEKRIKEENALREKFTKDYGRWDAEVEDKFKKEIERRKKATTIFQDTDNAWSKMTAKLSDKFKILTVDILGPFLPSLGKFADYITNWVDSLFPSVESTFSDLAKTFEKGLADNDLSEFYGQVKAFLEKTFSQQNIDNFKNKIDEFLTKILPKDMYDGIKDTWAGLQAVFSGISATFKFFGEHITAITTILGTVATVAAGGFAVSKIVDWFNLLKGLRPGAGPGGGGPGGTPAGGEAVGGALGAIGKGAGAAAGGILSGVATGIEALGKALSALGSPAVAGRLALGATAVGAAIAAIGAGIAGATWLMGAALPKLTEGLKTFESLEGAKLAEVGKSLGSLSLGLTEFAGSQFATAISGFLSIFSKFAGTDPLSVIKDMANFSSELPKLTAVSEGIRVFTESIKSSMEKFSVNFPDIKISDKFRDVVVFSGNAPALAALGLALSTLGDGWGKITEAFKNPIPAINAESLNSILSLKDKFGDFNAPTANTNSILEKIQGTNKQEARDRAEDTAIPAEPIAEGPPSALTIKTMQFYEESKQNNKDTKELLQQINMLLDTLNNSINSQTTSLSRSIVKASPIIT